MTKYVDPALSYRDHCRLCYGMLLSLCVRREDTTTLLRTRVSEHSTADCDVFKTFAGSNFLLCNVVSQITLKCVSQTKTYLCSWKSPSPHATCFWCLGAFWTHLWSGMLCSLLCSLRVEMIQWTEERMECLSLTKPLSLSLSRCPIFSPLLPDWKHVRASAHCSERQTLTRFFKFTNSNIWLIDIETPWF